MITTLCLVAIFKNESHILKEWIEQIVETYQIKRCWKYRYKIFI